jgi:hypothetical protein
VVVEEDILAQQQIMAVMVDRVVVVEIIQETIWEVLHLQ